MAVKGAKSIAEYAVQKWLQSQNFAMDYFELTMNGNEAEIRDRCGDAMTLVYDSDAKVVFVKE